MNKVLGIVCEYNPFHNGHLYQINKIKELNNLTTNLLSINQMLKIPTK